MIEFRHLEWCCEELSGPFSSKTTITGRNYFFKKPKHLKSLENELRRYSKEIFIQEIYYDW